jgi:transcriptional regulator NrdR family protein
MEIKIKKRSGRIEDFNEDKIVRSVTRAGAKLAVAKEILGIEIKEELPVLLGATRILKGIKMDRYM